MHGTNMELMVTEEDYEGLSGKNCAEIDIPDIQKSAETRTVWIRKPEMLVSQIPEEDLQDDSLPPWRSADRNGRRYLHVWEQDDPIQS